MARQGYLETVKKYFMDASCVVVNFKTLKRSETYEAMSQSKTEETVA